MKEWTKETIPGMLAKTASRWSDRTAIITDEGETISYRELYRRVCSLAAGLHGIGVRKGDHVATFMGTRPAYILASYAIMMTGAVVVPVNFNFQADEIAFLLDQSDARYLIMEDEINELDTMERIEKIFGDLSSKDPSNLSPERLPRFRSLIVRSYSGGEYRGTFDLVGLMERDEGEDSTLAAGFLSQVHPEDDAFIIYTSGTTAFPKGAIRGHGSSLGIAYYITVYPGRLTEKDVMLVYSPFFHIGGCVYNTLGAHICGCTTVLMKSFDPGRVLELIERHKVTYLSGFETHFYRIMNHPRFSSTDISSLTKVRLATGPSWYDRLKELGLGRELIYHHYGFTEGTGVVMPPEEKDYETRRNANGKPFPGVELKIVDPETGMRQPAGSPGEICLKGWTLFRGYYKMREQTQNSMDEEGFFHTGDYGWMDERGYLYFRGRYKQMVKSGGENVSQKEVEVFLENHPDIQAVQVIGVPDKEWGEAVTAIVQTQSGGELSIEEIKRFCKGNLAGFKIPKRVLNIDEREWPVTRVGKVDKIKLRQWAMDSLGIRE